MSCHTHDLTHQPSQLGPFFELRRDVYRRDRWHVPPTRRAERKSLLRLDYLGRQQILLATAHGRPVARVVARLTPEGLGCLGFFEAHDEPAPVHALLDQALDWLSERGATRIVGPMEGDTWHPHRFSLGPSHETPFLLEPHQPPYYARLWQDAGFVGCQDFVSQRVDQPESVFDRLRPRLEAAQGEGFRFEKLDLARFDETLLRLYRLSSACFAGEPFYRPISDELFLELYRGAKRLLDPDLVHIAVDAQGRDAGFLFAYPERRAAVAAWRQGRAFSALGALRRRPEAANLKTLAVLREHRRTHLGSALVALTYQNLLAKGYRRAHHCLMRDDNPSAGFDGGHGRLLRRYRLYEYGGSR